jgi:integrase
MKTAWSMTFGAAPDERGRGEPQSPILVLHSEPPRRRALVLLARQGSSPRAHSRSAKNGRFPCTLRRELLNCAPAAVGLARPPERTLGWLAAQWFVELEANTALEPGTKVNYRTIINAMLREVVEPGRPETYGDMPLDRITAKTVRNLRNRKRDKPTAGNARVGMLRLLFTWAMEDGQEYMTANPAADVSRLATRKGGFHTWSVAELQQFEAKHAVGSMARLALDLLSFTGARGSDVVKLGRQHVRDGWVCFTPVKTKRKGTMVKLPICAELAASINATQCGDLTFLVTERTGRPYRAVHFRRTFKTWPRLLGCLTTACLMECARRLPHVLLKTAPPANNFRPCLDGCRVLRPTAIRVTRKCRSCRSMQSSC